LVGFIDWLDGFANHMAPSQVTWVLGDNVSHGFSPFLFLILSADRIWGVEGNPFQRCAIER